MADLLIKNVPDGAEEDVKNLAMVAIERFLNRRSLVIDAVKKKEFEDNIDAIRTSNNVDAKFTVINIEAEG